jgi:hypothetical protein
MVAAVLVAAGCGMSTAGVVQHGDLPEESDRAPTSAAQLREILDWAAADGSVTALEAEKQAQMMLRRTDDSEAYKESVSRAWAHARAASQPDLDARKREKLWIKCVSELTHGPSGG